MIIRLLGIRDKWTVRVCVTWDIIFVRDNWTIRGQA